MAPIYLQPLLEIYCYPATGSCPHLAHAVGNLTLTIEELTNRGLIEPDPEAPPEDLNYERHGFVVTANHMSNSQCPNCECGVAGKWEDNPPHRSNGTGIPRPILLQT